MHSADKHSADIDREQPARLATVLARFSDALFPGDDLFPSASVAGAQGLLASRLEERWGEGAVERLADLLLERGVLDDAEVAARRLETEEAQVFDVARMCLTFAYYEAPSVVAAVRALGHRYNASPLPRGYDLPPFDPMRDAPALPRGSYVKTQDVRRVDLSALTYLEETDHG